MPILYKIYFVYITEIQISLSFSVFVHYQSLSLKIVYLKLSAWKCFKKGNYGTFEKQFFNFIYLTSWRCLSSSQAWANSQTLTKNEAVEFHSILSLLLFLIRVSMKKKNLSVHSGSCLDAFQRHRISPLDQNKSSNWSEVLIASVSYCGGSRERKRKWRKLFSRE